MKRKTQILLISVAIRTLCALATGHPMNPKLWTHFTPPTSVLYAVCDLHLLVHLQTLSLTFCAGLLLLLLLGVRLLALPVHRRGVHYYSRVRDWCGVWRCGVCHLVGGLRFQWGTPKMSHLGEKCKLSTRERPRHGEGGRETPCRSAGPDAPIYELWGEIRPEIKWSGFQNKLPGLVTWKAKCKSLVLLKMVLKCVAFWFNLGLRCYYDYDNSILNMLQFRPS